MVRRTVFSRVFGLLTLMTLLFSCQNFILENTQRSGNDTGQVKLIFESQARSTLLPTESLDVVSYTLQFSASGQTERTEVVQIGTATNFQLPEASWSLQVTGKNSAGFPLVRGSSQFTILSGKTITTSVSLLPISGSGTLHLSVTLNPKSANLNLVGSLNSSIDKSRIELSFTNNSTGFSLVKSDIPMGYYTLKVELKEGDTSLLTGIETVLITANGATKGSLLLSQKSNGSWFMGANIENANPDPETPPANFEGIRVYTQNYTHIHYWAVEPVITPTTWPGVALENDGTGWKVYEFPNSTSIKIIFSNNGGGQTGDLIRNRGDHGNWWYYNNVWYTENPLKPGIPEISTNPTEGRYNTSQNIELESSNMDDVIYYTLDGSTPSILTTKYASPIFLNSKTTIKAFGLNRDGIVGNVSTFVFDIDTSYDMIPANIMASQPGGSYMDPLSVYFTVTDNAGGNTRAYFTTESRNATSSDTLYIEGEAIGVGITGSTFSVTTRTRYNFLVVDASGNEIRKSFFYNIGIPDIKDFREETVYFLMTTRFYDGDPSNNFSGWDDAKAGNPLTDPSWRGDFKGLIEKLDYIKALGFSAVWVTPVVKNMSGYDYHGYHAVNHSVVDPRYESPGASYQDLIDAVHARGMRIVQDIVLNHTGNFGEENLHPLFEKNSSGGYINWLEPDLHVANALLEQGVGALGLAGGYAAQLPANQFQARIRALRAPLDVNVHYHNHEFKGGWEQYEVQLGSIAGDCQDLNTENPEVASYMRNSYINFINMGVDAFRIDTVKHISRLTFNNEFIPQFRAAGGDNFFMFGEVATRYRSIWNDGKPAISTPFFTWNATKTKTDTSYPWGNRDTNEASALAHYNDNTSTGNAPSSENHLLKNNTYRTPDWSKRSYMDVIDFPMHWAFNSVSDAWNTAVGGDWAYNDATFNVVYVDSHDYAPDGAPENQRYTGSWEDKLSLIFTFRGIPTIYYGTEIEFKKGAVIDVGPNAPLSTTGRAYFGDHIEGSVTVSDFGRYVNATGPMETTLSHPLATHIRALNLIRRAIPALQKGQYTTADASGTSTAFRRRYTNTEEGVDSFALVSVNGGATFTNVPNGTYRDVVTGESHTVSNGTASLSASGSGNLRVWVLYGGANQNDPGHVLAGFSGLQWIK